MYQVEDEPTTAEPIERYHLYVCARSLLVPPSRQSFSLS